MKIVRFQGGLGNQMFQYVFYLYMRQYDPNIKGDISLYDRKRMHNGFELRSVFGVDILRASFWDNYLHSEMAFNDLITKIRRKAFGVYKGFYLETKEDRSFGVTIDNEKIYFVGYWQNLKYFVGRESEIRRMFQFKIPLNSVNVTLMAQIASSESIGIHIRRGDYLNDKNLADICTEKYYKAAIETIALEVRHPKFFVFSDDINWCTNNLGLDVAVYITHNSGHYSYIDMRLMSKCKHLIISNSTFSWWSAWLNDNVEKRIYYPKRWNGEIEEDTTHLIPESWNPISTGSNASPITTNQSYKVMLDNL